MIERRISVVDAANPRASAAHLLIRGDEHTSIEEIRTGLLGHAPAGAALFVGSSLFPTEGTLGELPLVDGDRIGWGGPVQPAVIDRRWTRWELRLVGGPAAGRVVALPPGTHQLGRKGASIAVPTDRLMSGTHLEIEVDEHGATITDVGSANGTLVEGIALAANEPRTLDPDEVVQAGSTLLRVVRATEPELKLVPQPDGSRGLNRRFRVGTEEIPSEVAFPAVPEPGERPSLNILMMIMPAVLIGGLMLVNPKMGSTMLPFMLMGPLLGLGGAFGRRKQQEKRNAADFAKYQEQAIAARDKLLEARAEETRIARDRAPDPAAVIQCARAAGRLLWARRSTDPDLLELRVGSAERRSTVRAMNATDDDATLWQIPATVSLPEFGGLGIVGDREQGRALARSLVLQAATLHSPAEVRIVIIADEDGGEAAWGWTRWIPHCRWASDEPFVLVGSDPVSTRHRLEELRDLIRRRRELRAQERDAVLAPSVLVVYDGVSRPLSLGFAEVLRDGPPLGIHAISVDEVQVPEGCAASVTFTGNGEAHLEKQDRPTLRQVLVDQVGVEDCEVAARCLAPLRVIGEEGAIELPPQLRLLDVLNLPTPTPAGVADLWAANTRNPGAPVGLTTAGALLVDLTRDGPHGIIAGASRSGKSEFLKTFIASLAARNHPDDLSFLFIDFKGGNDYQVAATLPHTVDLATQIDQSGFERSLQLLDAEILRRQGIAKELQTSTLEGYWAAQAGQPAGSTPVMGRLVVIVDEFAELAQKSPMQLERLVSVARVGAAYGVHLILATQRPAGVVSGQIDANSPLRVCFRTTQKEHSNDVLGSGLAAEIAERHRGRGYKKAHQELPLEFQCARVGNARPGTDAAAEPLQIAQQPWSALGHLPPEEARLGEVPDPETDFYELAKAIRQAAIDAGWTRNAVPWPKPLPTVVEIGALPPLAADEATGREVLFAVADDPQRQAHLPAVIELGAGHVAIAGSGGTGRSTALRTVAAAAARSLPADHLHLFALDVAGGGLAGLAGLPHCAGVASDDAEVTGRILDHIDAAIRDRRSAFESVGAADLVEYNQIVGDDGRLPWLMLLIDGWEILHEESQTTSGSAVHDRILRLLADGQRFGLQAVLAGDRWVASGKVGRVVAHRFVLRFFSDVDYDATGLRSSQVPEQLPPGRAICADDGRIHQIAVLGDGSGPGQAEALRALVAELTERDAAIDPARRPRRIVSLPTKVLLSDLLDESPEGTGRTPVLLGVSAASGGPLWVDLATDAPGFVVAGKRRSGRSNVLHAMAVSALAQGVPVVAIAPRPSPIERLDGHPGVVALYRGEAAAVATFDDTAGLDRFLVLLDDIDNLDPMHAGIAAMVARPQPGRSIVVASTIDHAKNTVSGFLGQIRRSRSGVLICPESPYDGGALGGSNLPRNLVFGQPEGRAVISVAGEYGIVQLAKVEA
ncbi:MAG: FHA domain-containing protein [Acidimicrobiales bacterium]|nr:FHA domain-containing protein [Acidimicrobiales bacterium]